MRVTFERKILIGCLDKKMPPRSTNFGGKAGRMLDVLYHRIAKHQRKRAITKGKLLPICAHALDMRKTRSRIA